MTLPDAAAKAYASAETIVIEATDVLDQKALLRLKLEQPELMLLPMARRCNRICHPTAWSKSPGSSRRAALFLALSPK